MGRKSKTRQLIDSTLGQQLALSVAAHLARTHLVPEPSTTPSTSARCSTSWRGHCQGHTALCCARLEFGEPRELSATELEGALITRAATVITLKDGRSFCRVSVKRADLRQAIAILKAIGIEELTMRPQAPEPPGSEARECAGELRARLAEIEALLRPPLLPQQVEQANHLLISTTRQVEARGVANLAMAGDEHRTGIEGSEDMPDALDAALARLRTAAKAREAAVAAVSPKTP